MNKHTNLTLLLVAAFALSIAGCKQITGSDIVDIAKDVKESQKELTPENEKYIGRAVATSILHKVDYKYYDDGIIQEGAMGEITTYVNNVGMLIVAAAANTWREGDRPSPILGWHFIVTKDPSISGFSAPGGFVFVSEGAVKLAANEDELAALLAHEVAHVVRGHALGSIKKSRLSGVAAKTVKKTVDTDQLGELSEKFDGAMKDMTDALLVKGYSKDTEFEADKVGIEFLAAAGYDPNAMVSYLRRMAEVQNSEGGFFSTHPAPNDRIVELKQTDIATGEEPKVPKLRKKRLATVKKLMSRQSASLTPRSR